MGNIAPMRLYYAFMADTVVVIALCAHARPSSGDFHFAESTAYPFGEP